MAGKERFRRAGSWFARRGGLDSAADMAARGLDVGAEGVKAMRPTSFDRRGFFGRDRDGGIARFRAMADRLSASEIEEALLAWERDRGIFLVFAAACVAGMPLAWIFDVGTWAVFIGLLTAGAFFGIKALIADFRAWQLVQGRFAPPVEYLNHRLPRNMQIIEKE